MNAPQQPAVRRRAFTKGGAAVILASATLVGFVHQWEDGGKTKYTVYADKLAGGLPTACNGITAAVSPYPVVVGEVWSQEKCDAAQEIVLTTTQQGLAKCITGRITQNAFDALSSHAHNFGVGTTCGSSAVKLINAGQLEAGCRAISTRPDGSPNWSYVGQTFYRGLYNRRLDETRLCLTPDKP
ncbi:MAG: lysozyme [Burkholderiales bacterium]|nr:MAG: lysozyme [Burkholderiales bacterium]